MQILKNIKQQTHHCLAWYSEKGLKDAVFVLVSGFAI